MCRFSWNLGASTFLEPSGPLQACNGIALPLPYPVAAVQHTVTHKQYIEQHNEIEYTERNIHKDKNT
jgi:hypothetical protein